MTVMEFVMPSVSPSQRRLMAAAAHTKGGFGGVPQAVGREFNNADKGITMTKGEGAKTAEYAKGGKVLRTSNSPFMKTPDEFRDSRNKASDEDWGKKGGKKK